MKNRLTFVVISCLTIFSLWLVSCTLQQSKQFALTVSAAAVYRDVLPVVDKLYKQVRPNVTITYNFAGSGLLRKQIEQGAPADIFISGAEKEMDILQNKQLLIPETRQELTKNSIALIVSQDSTLPISSFQELVSERVKRIALGSEDLAAGVYTKETLTSLGIYEQVKQKGVFAKENIREVLKFVEVKQVDAGITFLTDAKLSSKVKLVSLAPENSHSPVISPIAVLKRCQKVSEAKEFIQFLKSDKAKTVFNKYGFTIIN